MALATSFPLYSRPWLRRMRWAYFKYGSLLPLPETQEILGGGGGTLYHETLAGFLHVKPMKMWVHPEDSAPVIIFTFTLASHSRPLTIQQNYHLGVSISLWLLQLLLQVSRYQQWFSVFSFLSIFQGGSLPYDLNLLKSLRKGIDFSLLAFFLLVRIGVTTSNLFMCQSLINENTLSIKLWKLSPSPWSRFIVLVLGDPYSMIIS